MSVPQSLSCFCPCPAYALLMSIVQPMYVLAQFLSRFSLMNPANVLFKSSFCPHDHIQINFLSYICPSHCQILFRKLLDNIWTNLEVAYFLIYNLVTLHLDKNRTYFGLDKYWTNWRPKYYRDWLKGLYVVARNLFMLLLTCSAWSCLGSA